MGSVMSKRGFREMDLAKLVKANWNYKVENADLSRKLVSNMKRNGQIENLLVRPLETGFYEVVNGNHRLDAMEELGIKKVMVFDLGNITDAQARRIAVETNETKFLADTALLADVIGEILEEFPVEDLTETMPYTKQEIEDYSKLLDFDWDDFRENGSGDGRLTHPEGITLVYTSEEEAEQWMRLLGVDYLPKTLTVQEWDKHRNNG